MERSTAFVLKERRKMQLPGIGLPFSGSTLQMVVNAFSCTKFPTHTR